MVAPQPQMLPQGRKLTAKEKLLKAGGYAVLKGLEDTNYASNYLIIEKYEGRFKRWGWIITPAQGGYLITQRGISTLRNYEEERL